MDEAVAGHATRIEVELDDEGYISVMDNGRGIPIGPHPKFPKKSALEIILTELHSGGKFSNKAYETSGGLHGVGVSVVNALSDVLEVEIARNKTLHTMRFDGRLAGPLKVTAKQIVSCAHIVTPFQRLAAAHMKPVFAPPSPRA